MRFEQPARTRNDPNGNGPIPVEEWAQEHSSCIHGHREGLFMKVTIVGLDTAKYVFQLHGVDEQGSVVLRRRLGREHVVPFFANLPTCRVGLEACGGARCDMLTIMASPNCAALPVKSLAR